MNDTIDELKSRIADLESAIRRCCRNCWANDATDAAQCRLCGLKEAMKGGRNEQGRKSAQFAVSAPGVDR